MINVAINGFGRIGRLFLRAALEKQGELCVKAINDVSSVDDLAHLFEYDSVHGRFAGHVQAQDQNLVINSSTIQVFQERNPQDLPWKALDIDVVVECTGRFTKRDEAQKHRDAGAKKVLISAPARDPDMTVVYGVNHEHITAQHHILSNASCTTNCLAPLAKVLEETVGIESGYMTTVHAYTADQNLVDSFHSDRRRARAAGQSLIPTSTGAAKAVGLVLPQLAGKLDGSAVRVPTANVSLVDVKVLARNKTSQEELNHLVSQAAEGSLRGVLGVSSLPLVSVDFNHNPLSSIVDLDQTHVINGNFCRLLSWYDNEWGFAHRLLDVTEYLKRFL